MKTRQSGNISINRILEMETAIALPLDFFDEAVPEKVEPHRHWLEPTALDPKTGKMILPIQSYLVRTRHHTILIDTCVGCHKTYDGMPEWKDRRDETWRHNLAAAGVEPGDVDYVFCTHLHPDHCGWNTRLLDGRWVPTFPNAKYIIAAVEYAASEAQNSVTFQENVLPVMAAGQVVLVDTDFALDDEVWISPLPGHTVGHVAVNIASNGQKAVMIGDLIQPPLQLPYPEWSTNFDFDPALTTRTRKQFLDQNCETETLILTAHLPSPSVGHVIAHKEWPYDFKYIPV